MDEFEVISIPISDGTERDFAILKTFVVDEVSYAAVALVEGDEIKEGEYIYRYTDAEDGDMIVETITSPAEFKRVSKVYQEL